MGYDSSWATLLSVLSAQTPGLYMSPSPGHTSLTVDQERLSHYKDPHVGPGNMLVRGNMEFQGVSHWEDPRDRMSPETCTEGGLPGQADGVNEPPGKLHQGCPSLIQGLITQRLLPPWTQTL